MAKEVKRQSTEVINYPTKSAGDIVEDSYLIFGSYVNSKRQLPLVMDGLKPSYRRLILASYTYGPKFTKTAKVTSMTQTWHPHGITGMVGVASTLIRSGVFEGSGNWGANLINGTSFGPAAERYTSLKISDTYYDIIGRLIKMVPWSESPMGDTEPDYLPTPIPMCLRWDTKVFLTDGRDITMKDLSNECREGKDNYVLCCDDEGDFRVTKVVNCWKTKSDKSYIRITLDNGEIINSTKDHKFMLRNGKYKEAKDLLSGESLMPGYISISNDMKVKGRRQIKNNFSGNNVIIYHLSDKYNIMNGVYEYDENKPIRHHIDKNSLNDNPNNIIRMSYSEHSKAHYEELCQGQRNLYNSERGDIIREKRRKAKLGTKAPWNIEKNKNSEFIQKVKDSWTPERREEASRIQSMRNLDPEFQKKCREWMYTEEGKERMSTRMRSRNSDSGYQRKCRRGKILRNLKSLISEIGYNEAIDKLRSENWRNWNKWFNDINDIIESEKTYNHKIISIEVINDSFDSDFYDIEVDSKYHNFLLSSGVIVHNCVTLPGIMGLGIGVSTKLPNFSPVSMYNAYLNNDPSLLRANCNINIDIKESELDKIWYEGKGKVCYKYNITRCVSDDGSQGVRIEGDTDIFLPKLKWFEQMQDQEKLFIREETDETGPKLFIGKNPNIRTISVDDIEEHAIKACRDCTTYSLNVTNGTQAFRIPLREWIKITYENYLSLVNKQKQQKIQEVEFNIRVAENTEAVANYIINENPKAENEEISQILGIELDVVNAIMSKSISSLRKNKDNSDKMKSLKSKLKEWKSLDPVKFTDEIINRL